MDKDAQIIIVVIVGVVFMLTIATTVIMFVTLHRKRYLSQQYAMERMEIEKREALLQTIITTQEEERNRISRNLHDGVGIDLSMVRLNLSRYLFATNKGQVSDVNVNEQLDVLSQTVENIRSICRVIYPSNFASNGLLRSLEYLLSRLNETGSIQCDYKTETEEELVLLNMNDKLALFRICQEVTNNLVKYANCSQLAVKVFIHENQLVILFSHNGAPFTNEDAELKKAAGNGIGLISIENRLHIIKGNIHYRSTNHQTTVELQIQNTK